MPVTVHARPAGRTACDNQDQSITDLYYSMRCSRGRMTPTPTARRTPTLHATQDAPTVTSWVLRPRPSYL